MDDSRTEWELRASVTCRPNGRVSARCLDWPRYDLPVEPSLPETVYVSGKRDSEPRDTGTLLADHGPSTSTKILPSLTSYFARSSAADSESTLMAACGWRALIARMASPLSGMATRDHSCSGEAPPGFGSTKGDVIEFRLASLGHGGVTLDKPGSDHLVGICLSEF
jgi:hypothetical protein